MLDGGLTQDQLLAIYRDNYESLSEFCDEVKRRIVGDDRLLHAKPSPVSIVKSRMKDEESLVNKVVNSQRRVDSENFLHEISDLAGLRIVVLNKSSMFLVKEVIEGLVRNNFMTHRESPKAYMHDQKLKEEFESRGFQVATKRSYYTSAHFLLQQQSNNAICCELQVRSVFDEVWGEVDHLMKYKPAGTENPIVDDLLISFAQLLGAADSYLDHMIKLSQEREDPNDG